MPFPDPMSSDEMAPNTRGVRTMLIQLLLRVDSTRRYVEFGTAPYCVNEPEQLCSPFHYPGDLLVETDRTICFPTHKRCRMAAWFPEARVE